MEYIAAKTKTGEAIHAADVNAPHKTLCGRVARYHIISLDSLITPSGIQHPWRCERCHATVNATEEE